jgi:hypothetical protein
MTQYKSNEVNQFIRKKQFTAVDFLSFVGGILGLFAGFSALSFVELIYWFVIRVFVRKFTKGDTRIHPIEEDRVNRTKIVEISEFLQSYLSESSIHGLGYISEFSRISRYIMLFLKLFYYFF